MVSTAPLEQAARALDASAREHKRLERMHREAARRDRQALDAFIAQLRAQGITVRLEGRDG